MEANYIELPMIMLYNIIPGTEDYEKYNFSKLGYNYMIENLPLFTPNGMSKKEFRKNFLDFHRKIFSNESIDKRLKKSQNIAMKYLNKGHQTFYQNEKWDEWIEKAANIEVINIK